MSKNNNNNTIPLQVKQLLSSIDLKEFNATITDIQSTTDDKIKIVIKFNTYQNLDKHWQLKITNLCINTIQGTNKKTFQFVIDNR